MLYESLEYTYPVARLGAGGSYGNPDCFIRTDAASNVDGVWLAATNQWVAGTITLDWALQPTATHFFPGHQTTDFAGGGLRARLTVFVPFGRPVGQGAQVYLGLEIAAEAATTVDLTWDVRWPAFMSPTHAKQPERDQWQKRVAQTLEAGTFVVSTVPTHYTRFGTTPGDPAETRVFGGPLAPAQTVFSEPGRLRAHYTLTVGPDAPWRGGWLLTAGSAGAAAARAAHAAAPDWEAALAATAAAYEVELATGLLLTPDPLINRGLLWAKANTLRVEHQFRLGAAFTNDPPQDIVVVRDCAWFTLGADWLTPGFVRAMIELLLRHAVTPNGKLTEYIHANTGAQEDYGLNVNDDTPLFVIAVCHHYAVSGDAAFLAAAYPAVRAACDWLLAQRRDGLVWCDVQGTDVWGNATWRNIIPAYRLAGAVTEINSETVWALSCAAALAGAAGAAEDATRWQAARAELLAAIRDKLRQPETGTYLLNRDEDGAHADLTADLVFPVLAGVAEGAEAVAILDRLAGPEFYTPFGIHTVARSNPAFHPWHGYGLLGGLWPNLTAWVAYAGRAAYPDRLVQSMRHLYALSEAAEPGAGGHLVPGEFPEWFDGATYESRGMAMSPWMPPTYLWLGLEGLAGIGATATALTAEPHLPDGWTWLALRGLPFRGRRVTLFAHAGTLYSTLPVESAWPVEVFAEDATGDAAVEGPLTVVALRGAAGAVVLVAAGAAAEGAVVWQGERHPVRLGAGEATLLRSATG